MVIWGATPGGGAGDWFPNAGESKVTHDLGFGANPAAVGLGGFVGRGLVPRAELRGSLKAAAARLASSAGPRTWPALQAFGTGGASATGAQVFSNPSGIAWPGLKRCVDLPHRNPRVPLSSGMYGWCTTSCLAGKGADFGIAAVVWDVGGGAGCECRLEGGPVKAMGTGAANCGPPGAMSLRGDDGLLLGKAESTVFGTSGMVKLAPSTMWAGNPEVDIPLRCQRRAAVCPARISFRCRSCVTKE